VLRRPAKLRCCRPVVAPRLCHVAHTKTRTVVRGPAPCARPWHFLAPQLLRIARARRTREALAHVRRAPCPTHSMAGLSTALHCPPTGLQAQRRPSASAAPAMHDCPPDPCTHAYKKVQHHLSITAATSSQKPAPCTQPTPPLTQSVYASSRTTKARTHHMMRAGRQSAPRAPTRAAQSRSLAHVGAAASARDPASCVLTAAGAPRACPRTRSAARAPA